VNCEDGVVPACSDPIFLAATAPAKETCKITTNGTSTTNFPLVCLTARIIKFDFCGGLFLS